MNYITRHEEGIVVHNGLKHILKTSINIYLDHLCKMYLSSLSGRQTASKTILDESYLIPFLVHETILLYPTHSHRNTMNHYINFHHVLSINKAPKGAIITFIDGTNLMVKTSKKKLQNQHEKAKTLWEYYECAKQKESVYIGVFPLDFLR